MKEYKDLVEKLKKMTYTQWSEPQKLDNLRRFTFLWERTENIVQNLKFRV